MSNCQMFIQDKKPEFILDLTTQKRRCKKYTPDWMFLSALVAYLPPLAEVGQMKAAYPWPHPQKLLSSWK